MSSRQNIEIDYCPNCRGVWLDRGELDKLIERSVAESSPPPNNQQALQHQRRPYASDAYERSHRRYDERYKKKSFWHELFD
jgi:Zn-finger nucleic acid-binding protein